MVRGMRIRCLGAQSISRSSTLWQAGCGSSPKAKMNSLESRTSNKLLLPEFFADRADAFDGLWDRETL